MTRLALASIAVLALAAPGIVMAESRTPSGRLVDLTHSFDKDTIFWPTEEGFVLENEHAGRTPAGYWYESNKFRTAEHGGTHMDAPRHFAAGRKTADQVPLDALVGPAVVVDVAAGATADRDYRLQVSDLTAWESRHGAPGERTTMASASSRRPC